MTDTMTVERTDHGFKVGAMEVMLLFSDDRLGNVVRVATDHHAYEIRSTPAGRSLTVEKTR